jgi:alpha-galactosidase
MDINPQRLETAYRLCQRYGDEMGIHFNLQKTLDRRESLEGADFVVNTALVAGHQQMLDGWEIGRKYGYRIGGSLHLMHDEAFWINFYQYRLFESIIEDMLTLCPDAWYIQVANPVLAGITYLGRKYPQAKIVGICHGFSGIYHLADALGLERDKITFEIPGVNHFVWLNRFYYKGEDAFPLIDQWLKTNGATGKHDALSPVSADLYRRFGVYPIGDTCTPGGGSWSHWYHVDRETEQTWNEDPEGWWFNDYLPYLEKHVHHMQTLAHDTTVRLTDAFPPKHSGEVVVPMIEAIAYDLPRVLICNIPNTGSYVPGVPSDFAVEIPAHVSKRGIQGIQTNKLPEAVLQYLTRDRIVPVEMELAAYEQKSRELLLQLVMLDPYTRSLSQAENVVNEILSLHDEMRQHYG